MLRWSNIKISSRILLGFGFAALLTLIVGSVSIYYLRDVGQRLTSIAEQDQFLLSSTLELQVAVEQESDGVRGYLLSDDQNFLEPFTLGQSHYSEAATKLEGLVQSDEDKGLLSDINTSHSNFLKIAEEEITLHNQGFPDSAIFLWQTQGNEIKSDLQTKLTDFTDKQKGVISQHAQEANDQQNQALAIALSVVVIAWVAGMVGGIWISRSITKPIKSLVSATQSISRGDLTTRTSIPGTDELAFLGGTMNQMAGDLAQSRETTERLNAQLLDLIGSLEQRVSDRTRELKKLEELGRAIVNAPPDASTLPDVLREYVPDMFPDNQILICIFPGRVVLHHPDDWPPAVASIWEWLCTTPETHCFLPGAVLPWEEQSAKNAVVVAPILDMESREPIGGIYLSLLSDPDAITNLLPAVQTLAAQIASALYHAKVYAETLAHQKIEQELALAGQIQESFLPDDLPSVPGWQMTVMLKPARETCGDFYDVIHLPNGRLGILIADVTDKGMGAALYMALSRTLIRTYAIEYDTQPELVFSFANRRILEDAHAGLFVTVFYGILDPSTGILTYSNAGHNPPYLFSTQKSNAAQELYRTGIPLGIFADATWEQRTVHLDPGYMLLLYTDGITEAKDAQEAFFDEERLLEVARDNLGRSAQEIQDAIAAQVDAFVGDVPQSDDIALIVVIRDSTETG